MPPLFRLSEPHKNIYNRQLLTLIRLEPEKVMTHDNSWPVAMKFMQIGASKIHDSRQVIMVSLSICILTGLPYAQEQ